jgi:hypothetical protein
LQNNGVEERGHQFLNWKALFLQTVDVSLRENSALTRDGMHPDSLIGLIAQLVGWDHQLGVDFVDDRAGTSRALIVHRWNFLPSATISILFEDDDFGVLTTELDYGVHFRVQLLYGERDSIHFLHKLGADKIAESIAAGAGDKNTAIAGSHTGFDLHETKKIKQFLCLACVVALIIAPENASAFGFDDQCFHRGGPNVQASVKKARETVPI